MTTLESQKYIGQPEDRLEENNSTMKNPKYWTVSLNPGVSGSGPFIISPCAPHWNKREAYAQLPELERLGYKFPTVVLADGEGKPTRVTA